MPRFHHPSVPARCAGADSMRIVGSRLRSLTTRPAPWSGARRRLHSLMSAPTIMRASDAAGLKLGIAGRDLLAAAQDGCGVAQPLHLFPACADVEDGAAFRLQPIQHDEELVGFLRRQHRGGLVKDQNFGFASARERFRCAGARLPRVATPRAWDRAEARKHWILAQPRRHVLEDSCRRGQAPRSLRP